MSDRARPSAWLVADYAVSNERIDNVAKRAVASGAQSVRYERPGPVEGEGAWVLTWANESAFRREARRLADELQAAGATAVSSCPKLP